MKKLNRTKLTPSSLNRSQQQLKTKPILTPTNIPGSSALISTMKMELSSIKHDVQKLMNDDIETQNNYSETTKDQIIISEYQKENERIQGKYDKLLSDVSEMKEERGRLEERMDELSREKAMIREECGRLEVDKARLEKQASNISHKLSIEKINLEKQNLLMKQELKKLKQQSSQKSEEGKWKEAWIELSGQVTLLEEEVKEKQSQIETKDQQILQLGWELQDVKEQKKPEELLQHNNAMIEVEFQKYREEIRKREALREQEREVEREKERQREQERLNEREKSRQRQRERKNEAQKEVQRNTQKQILQQKIDTLQKNNEKLTQVINELKLQSQSASKLHTKDTEETIIRNRQLSIQLQKQRNQSVELRTKNFNLTTDKQRLEQNLLKLSEQLKTTSSHLNEQIKRHLDQISKLKTRVNEQQALNLKLQNSLTINQAQTTNSVNFIKQTQLLHQINQKNTQIITLKNQLQQAKKSLSFHRTQTETEKMKVYTGEKAIKNHIEIELINKKSELESIKRKMDALNKKVDSRTSQLRQKDQFILNTIVNKINRESDQTEVEYIKKELQKYFSTTLGDKLIEAEKQIQMLKHEVETTRLNTN